MQCEIKEYLKEEMIAEGHLAMEGASAGSSFKNVFQDMCSCCVGRKMSLEKIS